MSIADLIQSRQLKEDERLTVELEFLPGWHLTLAHMTKQAYERARKQVEKTTFVKHVPYTTVDEQKLAKLLTGHVLAWKGLNARIISHMFWLKIADLSEEEKTAEIPFTPDDAAVLMTRHEGLSRWVLSNILDQDNFRSQLEGAEKNLPSGPASGPSPAESPASAAEPSATN
ncbi:MAG: hypothetical protein V1797_20865 [Pseudomonadota bacterium]